MFERQAVDFIQMEAGLNEATDFHVPLERMLREMQELQYVLFGIYSQAQRWPDGVALRRADPVFVARRLCPGL